MKPFAAAGTRSVPKTDSLRILPLTQGAVQTCSYSSSTEPDLKATLKKVIPAKRELLKKVKAHSDKSLGEVKVENTLGGMRYEKAPYEVSGDITDTSIEE